MKVTKALTFKPNHTSLFKENSEAIAVVLPEDKSVTPEADNGECFDEDVVGLFIGKNHPLYNQIVATVTDYSQEVNA